MCAPHGHKYALVFILAWKQTASECHHANFLPCLKHMLCQFMKIAGWCNHISPPISSQTYSMGDKAGDRADQPKVLTFSKTFLVWIAMWSLALSCWNIPFGTLIVKGMTRGFTVLASYWWAFSLPSASTKSALLSYPIAPHTTIPGVGEVCTLIIVASCDLSAGCLRTCWHRSVTNRSEIHCSTPQNGTQFPSWLWLYTMQDSVVCGMVSG